MADSNLLSKLKFRPDYRLVVINAPESYQKNLEGLQYNSDVQNFSGEADMIQIFAYNKADVDRFVPEIVKHLKYDGLLWLSYPKITSKIKTDISRDKGWDTLKALGLEGIALIAIDDTWSAMRFRPKEKIKISKNTHNSF